MKRKIIEFVKNNFLRVPKKYRKNHIHFDNDQKKKLIAAIESNYLDRGSTKQQLSEFEYQAAIEGQLSKRLDYNRTRIIPWLSKTRSLEGSTILEIGCGTGISTQALSEQGATVYGVDVDEGALEVAKERLTLAGYKPRVSCINGDNIKAHYKDQKFDLIIYYAVLEHMTVKERLSSLKQAWEMLNPGAFLVVIETPNRLWYYDSHTAALPFYDWLPDDLAFYYSSFSKRKNFNTHYRTLDDSKLLDFLRWGRGMSYHEFEVAILPIKEMNVVSSLAHFEKSHLAKYGYKGYKYLNFLRNCKRDLPKAFCYPYLDLIIQKN